MGGEIGILFNMGFESALEENKLPLSKFINYHQSFNSHEFNVGFKSNQPLEIIHQYKSQQYHRFHAASSEEINEKFIALILKSKFDGLMRPENDIPIHLVIVLDTSYSMGAFFQKKYQEKTKLETSLLAIQKLFQKLHKNDKFSLITFDSVVTIAIPLTTVEELDPIKTLNQIAEIKLKGQTIINQGYEQAIKILNEEEMVQCNKKIIFLTDLFDNTIQQNKINEEKLVQSMNECNISTTLIGLSDDFNESLCCQFTNIKGFKYYYAITPEEVFKYMIDHFELDIKPYANDLEIRLESEGLQSIEIFGLNYEYQFNQLPIQLVDSQNSIRILQKKSLFAQKIKQNDSQDTEVQGNLILLRLITKPHVKLLSGRFLIKCQLENGINYEYPSKFAYQIDNVEILSSPVAEKAVRIFYYVETLKRVLEEQNNNNIELKQILSKRHCEEIKFLLFILSEQEKTILQNSQKILKIIQQSIQQQ